MSLKWQCLAFEEVNRDLLYDIMATRQAVFVVEQGCAYQDLDGVDQASYHLVGLTEEGRVAAYARIIPPGKKYQEPSIGRVLTVKSARGKGYGRELIKIALENIEKTFTGASIRISGQLYLERLYQNFGFETVSTPYNEDNIPHIEMLKKR